MILTFWGSTAIKIRPNFIRISLNAMPVLPDFCRLCPGWYERLTRRKGRRREKENAHPVDTEVADWRRRADEVCMTRSWELTWAAADDDEMSRTGAAQSCRCLTADEQSPICKFFQQAVVEKSLYPVRISIIFLILSETATTNFILHKYKTKQIENNQITNQFA